LRPWVTPETISVDSTKRSREPEVVELRPAYAWDCPECGRGHFFSALVPEYSADEAEDLLDEYDIEPGDGGYFVSVPDEVECSDCGAKFPTELYRAIGPKEGDDQ